MRFGLATLAGLLLYAGGANATPAIDGSSGWAADCSSTPTSVLVLGGLTTSNIHDAIIVETGVGSVRAGYIASITDTAGLSWSRRSTTNDGANDWAEEWYAPAAAALSGDIITIHFAQTKTSGCYAAIAFGISGAQWPTPFDPLWQYGKAKMFGGFQTFTTKGTDDLLLAHYVTTVCGNPGPGAGWTTSGVTIPPGSFNIVQYMTVASAQTNTSSPLTVCGSGSVEMSNLDAFVSSAGLLAIEETPKVNTYAILQTGTATSKLNMYVIAEPAIGNSKDNFYVILNGQTNVLNPNSGLTLFHAFPP